MVLGGMAPGGVARFHFVHKIVATRCTSIVSDFLVGDPSFEVNVVMIFERYH